MNRRSTKSVGTQWLSPTFLLVMAGVVLCSVILLLVPQGAKTAVKPKGTPVVVMVEAPITSQIQNFPSIKETAKVMTKAINANGGVGKNHRPLKLIFCDDKLQPQVSVACTQNAIKNKAVAVIGGYNAFGDLTNPILQKAGIPVFEPYGLAPSDFSNPNSFPAPNGSFGLASGAGFSAQRIGCKKLRLLTLQPLAAFFNPLVKAAYRAAGSKRAVSETVVPVTATDYAPYIAAALANRPDCLGVIMTPTAATLAMRSYVQQKVRAKHILTCYGCVDEKTIRATGRANTVLNGATIIANFPVWANNKALAKFKGYIKQFRANQAAIGSNYAIAIRNYEAFSVFARIANGLPNVTASSFKKRLRTIRQIPDIFPGIQSMKGANWRTPYPFPGFNRLPNGAWIMSNTTIRKGVFVNLTTKTTNVGAIFLAQR